MHTLLACSDTYVAVQEPYVPVAALNIALEVLEHFMSNKTNAQAVADALASNTPGNADAATGENIEVNATTITGKRNRYEYADIELGERQMRLHRDEIANREKEHAMDKTIRQDEMNRLKEFNDLMSIPRGNWYHNNESLSRLYDARLADIYFASQTNRATTSSASTSTTNMPEVCNEPATKPDEEGPVSANVSGHLNQNKNFASKKTNPDLKIPPNVFFHHGSWHWKIQKDKKLNICPVNFPTMQHAIDSLKIYKETGVIDTE